MKIVEVYSRPPMKYSPVRIRPSKQVTPGGPRGEIPASNPPRKAGATRNLGFTGASGTLSLPTTDKRKGASSGGREHQKRRQNRRKPQESSGSTMRLDQVAKHEETLYLLDSETNQAILKNAVAKDELCRFLTPLKFIEIDTWRKEVPYGLSKENGTERRKWRTPLEILASVGDRENSEVSNILKSSASIRGRSASPGGKMSRRQGLFSAPVRTAFSQAKRLSAIQQEKSRLNAQIVDDVIPSTIKDLPPNSDVTNRSKPPNPPAPGGWRPATSPARPTLLTRINSEKGKPSERNSRRNDLQRGYSSIDSAPSGRAIYGNRTPRSSSSLRRSVQTLSSHSINNNIMVLNDKEKRPDELPSVQRRRTPTNDFRLATESATSRGANDWSRSTVRRQARDDPPSTLALYENLKPRVSNDSQSNGMKLQSAYSDPNIAYGPRGPSRSSQHRVKRYSSGNQKVRNYYAVASSQNSVEDSKQQNATSYAGESKAFWKLTPQTGAPSIKPEAQPFPARVIYHGPETSNQRSNVAITSSVRHHSPWVTQALPDPSAAERNAESEGYYVSRKHKSVTFRLADRPNTLPPSDQNNNHISPRGVAKVSMVVLDVDEPRKMLPRDGALTARTSSPRNGGSPGPLTPRRGFTDVLRQSQTIPLRP